MERNEMLSQLKERLEHLPEEKLKELLKRTKPLTDEQIKQDIINLSPRIRQNNKY